MSIFLGHSRDLMGNCIGFMVFLWNFAVNAKSEMGVLFPLNLNLELGPSVSNLGGFAVYTLGGRPGTSGGIMLVTEEDMCTLL